MESDLKLSQQAPQNEPNCNIIKNITNKSSGELIEEIDILNSTINNMKNLLKRAQLVIKNKDKQINDLSNEINNLQNNKNDFVHIDDEYLNNIINQ
jgi:hypothetical protein